MKTNQFFQKIEEILYEKYETKNYKISSMYLDERFSVNNLGELKVHKFINVNIDVELEPEFIDVKIKLIDE